MSWVKVLEYIRNHEKTMKKQCKQNNPSRRIKKSLKICENSLKSHFDNSKMNEIILAQDADKLSDSNYSFTYYDSFIQNFITQLAIDCFKQV